MFSRGVPAYVSFSSLQDLANSFHLNMPVHLILFVPPILTLLALVSMSLSLRKWREEALPIICVLALSFASIFLTNMDYPDTKITFLTVLPAILCFTVAVVSFFYNKFLSIWFLVAWFPFFRLYNAAEPILIEVSVPWIIIMAIWISKLPVVEQLSQNGKSFLSFLKLEYAIQFTLVLFLTMGFASQYLNLLTSYKVVNETVSASKEVANWLKANAVGDSVVITNSVNMRDLRYYLGGDSTIDFRETAVRFEVSTPTDYEKFVKEHSSQNVYLLIILTNVTGEKAWIINNKKNPVELQEKFQVVCRYPTLDPLMRFLPQNYRVRGGLPDAARETRINTGLFWQETFIGYGLYKVVRG